MHTDASPAARRDLKHRARRSHFDALVRAPREKSTPGKGTGTHVLSTREG